MLWIHDRNGASLGDFNATNFAQLVAAVGPHVDTIVIEKGCGKLLGPPFWASLRSSRVPARKLLFIRVTELP